MLFISNPFWILARDRTEGHCVDRPSFPLARTNLAARADNESERSQWPRSAPENREARIITFESKTTATRSSPSGRAATMPFLCLNHEREKANRTNSDS
jgi:hypothetical protein